VAAPRQLHLNLNVPHAGTIASAWRWPASRPGDFAETLAGILADSLEFAREFNASTVPTVRN